MPSLTSFLQSSLRRGRAPDADAVHSINQRIFDTSLDLILVVDSTGHYRRVSPSVEATIGYRPADLIGRNGKGFIHPDDLGIARDEMRLVRHGRRLRNFTCRYRHRDGHDVPLAWAGLWSEPDRQYFFIGRDMTAQILAEERARRAHQLEAIGQLTGGIAHDFNNLLAVIIGSLELLDPHLRQNLEAADHLLSALNAAARGAELTGQLLAFARRRPLNSHVLDINACIAGCLQRLRDRLGERVEIRLSPAASLWPVVADAGQLEAALTGLCHNAATAMDGAGVITIATANGRLEAAALRDNPDAVPGEYAVLSVADRGRGMAPEVLARVFEPFFTTRPDSPGAGLGLSIIHGFVRQLHGHMEIDSAPERGTEVRIYLPRTLPAAATARVTLDSHLPALVTADVEAAADAEAADSAAGAAAPCILVVEDNENVRRVMVAQLAGLGYRTVATANGETALRILKSGDAVDLLFSDVLMPGGISGVELAQAARQLRPDLKVLLTSGFVGAPDSDTAQAGSFANFLAKPYRQAELATALKAILERE